MKRSLAGAAVLLTCITSCGAAFAQGWPAGPSGPAGPAGPGGAVACNDFVKLSAEAQKRGNAVSEAMKTKVDRKQICALMNNFITAETTVVKFLIDNQSACGVPAEAITGSKASHEKSLKFRTAVCSDAGPQNKPPSLSDAIKSPTVDNASNTKTGRGTFDSLTGNPLSR
jgi:hypothetical protein